MLTPLQPGEPSTVDVLEGETPRYTATLKDETGAVLPAASLSTLTLKLYVTKTDGTDQFIRGSAGAGQNVLNANNVTINASGAIVWLLQVADTTLVEAIPYERHIALWEWTWPTSRAGKHEVWFNVKALNQVP